MRDINRIFGKLLFSTEEEVRFIANHSQERLERVLARLLLVMVDHLTLDYEGQRREKNGQFGKGKKPKSASSAKPGNASNAKSSEQAGKEKQEANNNKRAAGEHTPSKAQSKSGEGTDEKQFRKALMSSPKENISGIQRHICNEAWCKQRNEALSRNELPKSGLIIKEQRMRSMVKNRLKTGDFTVKKVRYGDLRAYMTFKEPIGMVFYYTSKKAIKCTSTRTLCVVFSKHTGYHFFPIEEKEASS